MKIRNFIWLEEFEEKNIVVQVKIYMQSKDKLMLDAT